MTAAAKPQPQKSAKAARRKAKRQAKQNGGMLMSAGPNPQGAGSLRRGPLGLRIGGNFATTRRSQVIEEDEYIGEVSAGALTFNVSQYACNPGQSGTFPWGNKIAQLYEKYEFEYLEFYYKREVSEFANYGSVGKVILSFDYDASDPAPATKQQMEDTVPHSDGIPSEPIIRLPIDCACARKSDAKYVRPGAQPANTDLKTYDIGNLNVATYGLYGTSGTLGELRVRYRVRFSEPVLESYSALGGMIHFTSLTATSANNFNGAVLQPGGSTAMLGITCANNQVAFPAGVPGNYKIDIYLNGATSAGALSVSAVTGGVAQIDMFANGGAVDSATTAASLAGTTTAVASLSATVSVGATGHLAISPATIVTSGAGYLDVYVTQIPTTLVTMTKRVGADACEVSELRDEVKEMRSLLARLVGPSRVRGASEGGLDMSEPTTPYESKEVELEKSIHLPATAVQKLLRAVGAK